MLVNFLSKLKQWAEINVNFEIYLYWGLLRNVSGWFKQPPALFARSEIGESTSLSVFEVEVFAVVAHDPNSWVSFHVFDNENIDVLINRQTDISLKCAKKSSNGILQKILSCCTIFWPIFIIITIWNFDASKCLPEFSIVIESQPQFFTFFFRNIWPFRWSRKKSR